MSSNYLNAFGHNPRRRAFTIVELLVATTVLALIVSLIAQLMNSATNTTSLSTKQADEDNEAREVFNIMASDFAGMLRRSDVDYFFYKNNTSPGNDSMWFYSRAPSYFIGSSPWNTAANQSPITWVGYRVPTTNNRADSTGSKDNLHPNFVLERVGRPTLWANFPVYYLTRPMATTANPNPTPDPNSTFYVRYGPGGQGSGGPMGNVPFTDGDYRTSEAPTNIVSHQVFRMEFCFLLNDGTYMVPATPPTPPSGTAVDDMRKVGTSVEAIIVAIALLDEKSRIIVSDMSKAAAALPDVKTTDMANTPPTLMAEKWNTEITNGNFKKNSGLPAVAAAQVRIYQRAFNLSAK